MPVDLQAVILGIIEGLTEFLPVSSTGHLLLAMKFLHIDDQQPSWEIFLYGIQVAAVLAIVIAFGKRIWRFLFSPLLFKLIVALLPAVVVGLLFDKPVEEHLHNPPSIAIALVLGAALMVLIERRWRDESGNPIEAVTWMQALWIGVAQCVSIIPGTSRAMATILGGLIVGLSPAAAVEFSFYLAAPTILGATILKLHHYASAMTPGDEKTLAIGSLFALVSAAIVVRWFLHFVARRRMTPFAIYRAALGVAVGIWWIAGRG